ncbi:MAG TPA: hypothetical protein VG223_09730 [Solirubrobacteraceae bacterium]|jgi:hypothetical protein|nr:hypothetical protein [Solirubrobacteraceae bacterium]
MCRRVPLLAFWATLLLIVAPVGARAASPASNSPVIAQCEATNQVTGHFTAEQLQYALNHLPVDIAEYSTCSDAIHRALLAALGKPTAPGSRSGGSSGGSSFLPAWLIVLIAIVIVGGGAATLATRRRPRHGDGDALSRDS